MSAWNKLARRLNLSHRPPHGDRFLKLAAEARKRVREIKPIEAADRIQAGALLIDVRERGEYALLHAKGAENLARGIVELEIERYAPDSGTNIICYCGGGSRSALVADNLQRMGYENTQIVADGLQAWIKAGLPTASEREALD